MQPILITIGDPAGIGCEVSLKALNKRPEIKDKAIIVASRNVVEHYVRVLGFSEAINYIAEPEEAKAGVINVLDTHPMDLQNFEIGKVSSEGGEAAYQYVAKAIELAMNHRAGAVVTGPLNKEALRLAGHQFDGHTEIFSHLTGSKQYAMMLWSQHFAVVHVSTHCSLQEACLRVKKARVMECIQLADDAIRSLGIETPKIAVAGLNPHSGEAGLFGKEEIEEITPAIVESCAKGMHVEGPVPPDTVFLKAKEGKFDVVIAMYHDQGHIPMKLLAFDTGVNTTLGLPIVRTSVDHGTAFDIAGKNVASEISMISALDLANRFIKNKNKKQI